MKMQNDTVLFQVRLPIFHKLEGDWHIASCHVLDVHSQGHTKEEATKNIIEAIQLFIESCFERGTLERVLKDRGFKAASGYDKDIQNDEDFVDIPLPMLVKDAQTHAC